jgi:hypothetical protein
MLFDPCFFRAVSGRFDVETIAGLNAIEPSTHAGSADPSSLGSSG